MIKYGRKKVVAVEVPLPVEVSLIVEAEVLLTVEATVQTHPDTVEAMVETHPSRLATAPTMVETYPSKAATVEAINMTKWLPNWSGALFIDGQNGLVFELERFIFHSSKEFEANSGLRLPVETLTIHEIFAFLKQELPQEIVGDEQIDNDDHEEDEEEDHEEEEEKEMGKKSIDVKEMNITKDSSIQVKR
ncbi:hypothetical protein Bca4012_026159 [Brassica carinata]